MECLLPYVCMVTVPHIMVGLERMLDYKGVGLARFHCTYLRTFTSHNLPHSVEEAPVPGIRLSLVMNELNLNGLHGAYYENGLRHSSP